MCRLIGLFKSTKNTASILLIADVDEEDNRHCFLVDKYRKMYIGRCIILLCLGNFHTTAMDLNAARNKLNTRMRDKFKRKFLHQDREIVDKKKKEESTSNDPDDEIVVVGSSKSNEIRYFNPVDELWQNAKCIQFQVPLENYLKLNQTIKILKSPLKWIDVKPDGNCFYRALSYWVSGTENHHHIIRERVMEIVLIDQRIVDFLGVEHYYTHLKNLTDISWATEVEIVASTILLNTSIYVYSQSRKTWDLFDHDKKSRGSLTKTDKCIYIQHVGENHYNLVTDVIPDQGPNYIVLDDERKIVEIQEDKVRYYNPVNAAWQQEKCKKLNLILKEPFQYDQTPKFLMSPKKWVEMQKDKNCFFRALSYWVTGTEDNHEIIRQKISKEVNFDSALQEFNKKKDSESFVEHYDWATRLEIMASAIFLETSIFIYINDSKEWDYYNKNITLQFVQVDALTEKCIYLREINPNEYDVVQEVEDFNYS